MKNLGEEYLTATIKPLEIEKKGVILHKYTPNITPSDTYIHPLGYWKKTEYLPKQAIIQFTIIPSENFSIFNCDKLKLLCLKQGYILKYIKEQSDGILFCEIVSVSNNPCEVQKGLEYFDSENFDNDLFEN